MANFLKKLQDLPLERKKIILWSIVGILGLVLFSVWFKNFQAKVKSMQNQTGIERSVSLK